MVFLTEIGWYGVIKDNKERITSTGGNGREYKPKKFIRFT